MRVEPAFAAAAIGAGGNAFRRHPGKAAHQRVGVLEQDVGALGHLRRVVRLEDRQPLVGGKDEIAAFAKTDIGVRAELFLQPPKQLKRELRQADVFRDRELLADRGHGQRRRRGGEFRVALDQRDRTGKPFLAQIIGDRTADDGPADDDDVVTQDAPRMHTPSPGCFAATLSPLGRGGS